MVIELSELRGLITAYRAGFDMEKIFAGMNKLSNQARFEAQKYQNWTEKFLKWIHAIFTIIILIVAGVLTNGGKMTTGQFVTLVSTVQKYDSVICALFDNLFDCVNGFVSVQKIA